MLAIIAAKAGAGKAADLAVIVVKPIIINLAVKIVKLDLIVFAALNDGVASGAVNGNISDFVFPNESL